MNNKSLFFLSLLCVVCYWLARWRVHGLRMNEQINKTEKGPKKKEKSHEVTLALVFLVGPLWTPPLARGRCGAFETVETAGSQNENAQPDFHDCMAVCFL